MSVVNSNPRDPCFAVGFHYEWSFYKNMLSPMNIQNNRNDDKKFINYYAIMN